MRGWMWMKAGPAHVLPDDLITFVGGQVKGRRAERVRHVHGTVVEELRGRSAAVAWK